MSPAENDARRIAVLVVEDEATNRIVARAMLSRLGCEVDFAENGEIGFEMVQVRDYDLVIMDCMMPVMDGLTATRAIRDWERESNRDAVPIVAFTALSQPRHKEECLEAGMDDFMTKPARGQRFREVLDQWAVPQA
ncbi:MAG: response regulator [Planctomycetota bacterium]